MSLIDLFYRFRPITPQALPIVAADFGSKDSTAIVVMQPTDDGKLHVVSATTTPAHLRSPNRKSEAMKKVWAERKAREAGK